MPGLKFYKLDLHTHTPASKCYRYREHTADQIVQAAIDRGLAAIAVTDHNTAEWIDAMRQAARGTSLVIFPGVEISMNDGFHLLALFDPAVDQKHVESFLGYINITPEEYGKQDALCTQNAYEVIKKIHERKGLAVLAHIDRPKGAFFEQAKPKEGGKVSVPINCSKLFNEAGYDAVECVDGRLPDGFDATHQFKRYPAFYQASDNPDPEKPTRHSLDGLGTQFTWFKLDQIGLEGLRQCFSDPEVRIRLMDAEPDAGYPMVVSLQVGAAGFLRNQTLAFQEGLNSVIGGKGVGKSLAIEFLRYGLEQTSSDINLAADLLSKLERRLEAGNTVRIVYQTADGTQYEIARTFERKEKGSNGYRPVSQLRCVNLATGVDYTGDIAQMFPILAYSQTEIIKIAENKEAQLELIDRFIDTREVERTVEEVRRQLKEDDIQLSRAIQARDRLVASERDIRTLQEQIETINKSLINPLFDAMKMAEDKKKAFEGCQNHIGVMVEKIREWRMQWGNLKAYPLPGTLADDVDLQQQQAIVEQARVRGLDVLQSLMNEIVGLQQLVGDALTSWSPEFNQVAASYAAFLQEIGGDREAKEKERKRLEKEKSNLDEEARDLRRLTEGLSDLLKNRAQLLDRLEGAYRKFYESRKRKFDQLTRLSDGKLKLALEHAANHSEYEAALNNLLKGGQNAPSVADRRQIAQSVAPRRLVQLVLDRDDVRLADEAGITELWAGRAIEKLWASEDFVEVLALQHNCYPSDVPSIRFRKEGGQYDELNELSIGQKCTALLIIALCDGAMPVVIDQPEDALDIISVWEDIAKKLRRGKNSRQFILTTHNSSVAVAADSDQFIVLNASANYGKVAAAGAIDRPDVRDAVIKHLEGGDEPYRLRSRKYNIA